MYVVQAGSTPFASDLALFNISGTTTFAVTAPPGSYFVRVVAINAYGASPPSNEVGVAVNVPRFNVTGHWRGVSNYINAPFEFDLVQFGSSLAGTYQDQHDRGGVGGRLVGSQILLDVNFGDTGIRFEGTVENDNLIRGTIFAPVLGGRRFVFEMTR
jgi:hypothetical protein